MLSNSLVELDRQHLIHPVAPYRAHEARGVTVISSGEGAYLRDAAGNRLLDGFAGLWCVNAGYGQPTIIEAINRQLQELQYATGYFHFGADTTIRFIRYYFNALGKPEKKQFITLEQGYHGSSSTGSGLTALPLFHAGFDVPLAWQHRIPSPYPYRNPVGSDG